MLTICPWRRVWWRIRPRGLHSTSRRAGLLKRLLGAQQRRPAIGGFYDQALPALGWQAVGGNTWVRGAEQLQIQVERNGPSVIVQYSLSPRDR
jgi:hypothetical protein